MRVKNVSEWIRWGLTMIAIAITFANIGAVRHESTERSNADRASLKQRDATDAKLARAIKGNCIVVSVLLENRADRDATVKLFAPIRNQNPEQFDKLIKRAEKGDTRLAKAVPLLSCNVSADTLKALRN